MFARVVWEKMEMIFLLIIIQKWLIPGHNWWGNTSTALVCPLSFQKTSKGSSLHDGPFTPTLNVGFYPGSLLWSQWAPAARWVSLMNLRVSKGGINYRESDRCAFKMNNNFYMSALRVNCVSPLRGENESYLLCMRNECRDTPFQQGWGANTARDFTDEPSAHVPCPLPSSQQSKRKPVSRAAGW